uniref:Quaternary ammonium compound resistance protein n=2 Tax=Salmonella enterica I TaxID=59201 RepID=A0A0P0I7S4_SALET|nr:quaternary ammonium compound resistance protein [Salmonella enterica subsp. enterica serovar Agona]ALJ92880.1 quaternary ammonium compound resistance protein [Salmonella enterica subsp. enterica serovar Senftenberg]
MKGWLFLVIAIVGEVIATSALKSSEGFTKLAPSAVVIIGYGIAFYFLSLVLKSIPVGVAYASLVGTRRRHNYSHCLVASWAKA